MYSVYFIYAQVYITFNIKSDKALSSKGAFEQPYAYASDTVAYCAYIYDVHVRSLTAALNPDAPLDSRTDRRCGTFIVRTHYTHTHIGSLLIGVYGFISGLRG